MNFKCTCPTTQVCKDFLSGKVDLQTLHKAVVHHENHACPDFQKIYDFSYKTMKENKSKAEVFQGVINDIETKYADRTSDVDLCKGGVSKILIIKLVYDDGCPSVWIEMECDQDSKSVIRADLYYTDWVHPETIQLNEAHVEMLDTLFKHLIK